MPPFCARLAPRACPGRNAPTVSTRWTGRRPPTMGCAAG